MTRVSLVIPCYNEAAGLDKLFRRCIEVCSDSRVEIVLVNNGSSDNSEAKFRELSQKGHDQIKIVSVPENLGYGHGIVQGLKACTSEFIGWTHADLQTDPIDVIQALELIQGKTAPVFVKGKRFGRPMSDVVFTVGMSLYESLLLRTLLWDINAQPTIFPAEFFQGWVEPPSDFSLDLFAYYMAKRENLAIKRFKVRFGAREFGSSSWNVNWGSKVKFIKRTIKFSRELAKRF